MQEINVKLSDILAITCQPSFDEESKTTLACVQLDIFDHFLTVDEANELMLSYPVLKSEKADMTKYYEKEELICSFLLNLYKKYQIVSCQDEGHLVFEHEKEFKKVCIRSIREIKFFLIHLPELELTITGGYDMHMVIYYPIGNHSGLSILKDELKKFNGLYILYPSSS